MLDINHSPFTFPRITSDIKEVDALAELISQLGVPIDIHLTESFHRLVELAGSRDFLPLFSSIQEYVHKLKWAREGLFNTGYIVPWMSLYANVGNHFNNQLVSIATHYSPNSSISSAECSPDGERRSSNGFKSPLIKPPFNAFGNGFRPVELNRDDWRRILTAGITTSKPNDYPPNFLNGAIRKRNYAMAGPNPPGNNIPITSIPPNKLNTTISKLQNAGPKLANGEKKSKKELKPKLAKVKVEKKPKKEKPPKMISVTKANKLFKAVEIQKETGTAMNISFQDTIQSSLLHVPVAAEIQNQQM
ncbi:hypothetical protein BC833DRAFT_608313 [Globomyces pollinis-pini]|nr:hypothetical protein BC833DRAFT_608313 [Globomyces pollinis-pini]